MAQPRMKTRRYVPLLLPLIPVAALLFVAVFVVSWLIWGAVDFVRWVWCGRFDDPMEYEE